MTNILNKKLLLFQPTYIRDFSCIGPTCEDNCCYAWEIRVDKKSFLKYQAVDNDYFPAMFKKYLIEHNDNYKIKHKNNVCPFFDQDKLCMIHKGLGEDFLCDTCTIYPRTFNIINDCVEVSGSISCPEIARLILSKKDGLVFEYSDDFSKYKYLPKRISTISNIIDKNDVQYQNSYIKYLYDMRNFCIDVVQNHNTSLDANLIILGLFIEKIELSIKNNEIDKIPYLIELYSNYIKKSNYSNIKKQKNTAYYLKINTLFQILSKRASNVNKSYTFNTYYKEFLEGFNYSTNKNTEEMIGIYNNCYKKYFKTFFNSHNHILENYLVNYIFKTLFPLDYNNELFKQYCSLAANYSLLKLFLVGIASFHKGLNEKLVVEVIQSYAKLFNHNSSFMNKVYDQLQELKMNDMNHTSIFIMD